MSDLVRKVVEEASSPETAVPERTHPKNCHACANSYMEPSGPPDLICGHPDAGSFGKILRRESKVVQVATAAGMVVALDTVIQPADHCGDFTKFEQHPLRQQNGDLLP